MANISECSICLKDFKEEPDRVPRILKCGDTFCTNCIKTSILIDKKVCPICISKVDEDIEEMIINYYALNPTKTILCDLCLEEFSINDPEKLPKILKCGHTFCAKCLKQRRCNDKIKCMFCSKETDEEVDKLIMNKCALEECIKELLFSFKYIDEKKIDINKIDFQFSIGLMGESNGGKTSISHYFHTGQSFEESPISTIGLDYHYKYVSCKKKTIKITLWDTAGQERFGSVAAGSLRGVQGLLLVFSLTPNFNSKEKEEYDLAKREEKEKLKENYTNKAFKHVEFWLEQFNQFNQQKKKVIYLIGNKCDDEENRIIDLEDAKYFAKDYELKYYETSAKTGRNIKKLFEDLTIELMDLYPDQKISNFHLKRKNSKKSNKCC